MTDSFYALTLTPKSPTTITVAGTRALPPQEVLNASYYKGCRDGAIIACVALLVLYVLTIPAPPSLSSLTPSSFSSPRNE